MPVIINFKICDNAEACNAIRVCPTGAFHWDESEKTLKVDENKCINCGLCKTSSESCQVGAIEFAKDQEEFEKIKAKIENDKRTVSDLMVDRYGGQPINMPFYCKDEELSEVLTTKKVCIVEAFNDDSIECLIKSIPIKNILKECNVEEAVYRKVEVLTEEFMKKYNINVLPSLLIFKNGNLIGNIEGYIDETNKDELIAKIKQILA